MPAIITHYCFGEDALVSFPDICGSTRDECDAFLLGNQGPDPLFFVFGPEPFGTNKLARRMHNEKTAQLLAAFRQATNALDGSEKPIARAYAHGFLCHYLLDSIEHPLVHALVNSLCEAGVDGLSSEDKSSVHTFIEREWDELTLTVKHDQTVATFPPVQALRANEAVLAVAQKLYAFAALATYGHVIETDVFPRAVAAYRIEQRLLYSRSGLKRSVLARIEETVRDHSYIRSATPRAIKLTDTWLANPQGETWENPFTGQSSTHGFWDLYDMALARVAPTVAAFESAGFDEAAAGELTANLNFCGQPTVAMLTVHE